MISLFKDYYHEIIVPYYNEMIVPAIKLFKEYFV